MIKLRIKEIAQSKGIENAFQLTNATGLNYAQCHHYFNGEVKQIGMDALNRICFALKVKPAALFEYIADEELPSPAKGKRKA
jgi:DNA-binding Xre family transcriptional regulator